MYILSALNDNTELIANRSFHDAVLTTEIKNISVKRIEFVLHRPIWEVPISNVGPRDWIS
jgi:hypothetical protein